jgi:hypothetical protein
MFTRIYYGIFIIHQMIMMISHYKSVTKQARMYSAIMKINVIKDLSSHIVFITTVIDVKSFIYHWLSAISVDAVLIGTRRGLQVTLSQRQSSLPYVSPFYISCDQVRCTYIHVVQSNALCSAVCAFLYPGYASYKTLSQRPASEADLEKWLMYWSVLGSIVAVEYVAEWLISW